MVTGEVITIIWTVARCKHWLKTVKMLGCLPLHKNLSDTSICLQDLLSSAQACTLITLWCHRATGSMFSLCFQPPWVEMVFRLWQIKLLNHYFETKGLKTLVDILSWVPAWFREDILTLQVQLKPLYVERMFKYLNGTVYSPHRRT
jgi:hypothetical protein